LTHPAFEWTARRADDWRRRPADWPGTRYEAKAAAEGRRATYLVFGRRAPSATK
jgi:tRNA (guanine-N7-)-methyltransferase